MTPRSCHFVTNYHVIEHSEEISLTMKDGQVVPANVVAKDPSNDIAVLKGDCESTPLPIRSEESSMKGHPVFTIGYPLVPLQGTEQKVSFGHANADSGLEGDIRLLQIDIPVQPGNSGSPLMDEHGNVIGIVSGGLNQVRT